LCGLGEVMKIKKNTTTTATRDNVRKLETAAVEFPGYGEEIRLQAYYNFLDRIKNNRSGSELGDWLEAEKTVRRKIKAS
jgi:hypothetical protein